MSQAHQNLLNQVRNLVNEKQPDNRSHTLRLLENTPENYTWNLDAQEFYDDLQHLSELDARQKQFNGRFYNRKQTLVMKIYLRNKDVRLSAIIRILDNLMLNVNDHSSFTFQLNENSLTYNLHEFKVTSNVSVNLADNEVIAKSFFETFEKILNDEWNESPFNKFSLTAGLNFREIQLLTAFNNYYRQVGPKYDAETIQILTNNNSSVFEMFVRLFHLRFNPNLEDENRLESINATKEAVNAALNKIDVLDNYKTLKNLYEILLAISRTNYYQGKSYIALKIRPSLLSYLTGTQPFAEVFVYAYEFEAVHLRESKVSRGGLRWSDRRDYRTEVLGLMRAQMKKNTIIIPQGAKGGFLINHPERYKTNKDYVVQCYKTFLSGILDVTDNLDNKNQIIRPPHVILPADLEGRILSDEEQDPYVVVAADKGTGTFSDYANSVAQQYKFWLDDAFASGGSNGYDHKKLAITSRGAWVTVRKLFNELGVDINELDFTVIGIGDMFSDVFGNGMLLSNHIKLLASFNHMHIFIDPNPDPLRSFDERARLFKMPYSSWTDYNRNVISEGGGVWSRRDKSINITKQVAEVFDIPSNVTSLSPDELIRYILKGRADLLWNGGIGTFFKGENETHEDAADKSNDNIRINGNELRVRVAAEGGNLGFTQLSRIEYARKGGKINTDFIDNSAGVSCSDREVNIKITMSSAVRNNRITLMERNQILSEMDNDVCELVLKDNLYQNHALMLEESYKFHALDKHIDLMMRLEKAKVLNRRFERLPTDQQLEKLKHDKQALTRPELSVLLAYTKIWLKGEILKTTIPENQFFEPYLISYFPKLMQERFRDEILSHPLRREIITNFITNTIVNRLGVYFVFSVIEKTGHKLQDIIYAFFVILESYKLRDIWHDLEYNHYFKDAQAKINALLEIRKFAVYEACWLLRTHDSFDVQEMISLLSVNISKILQNFNEFNSSKHLKEYNDKYESFLQQGLRSELAENLAKLGFLVFIPSLIEINKQFGVDLKVIAKLYSLIEEKLELRQLRRNILNWRCYNITQETAVQILNDNIKDEHLRILRYILAELYGESVSEDDLIEKWSQQYNEQLSNYLDISDKVYYESEIDYSHVILLISRLGTLHRLE